MTEKEPKQLIEQYALCRAEKNVYVIDGKKITVVRRFTGEKNINRVIYELAVSRACREMGLQ